MADNKRLVEALERIKKEAIPWRTSNNRDYMQFNLIEEIACKALAAQGEKESEAKITVTIDVDHLMETEFGPGYKLDKHDALECLRDIKEDAEPALAEAVCEIIEEKVLAWIEKKKDEVELERQLLNH